jgi:hypothetical protein
MRRDAQTLEAAAGIVERTLPGMLEQLGVLISQGDTLAPLYEERLQTAISRLVRAIDNVAESETVS